MIMFNPAKGDTASVRQLLFFRSSGDFHYTSELMHQVVSNGESTLRWCKTALVYKITGL